MRAFVAGLVIAFAGVAAVSPVVNQVRVAAACSCGDCDFVSDAAFVVRGTFVGWDYVLDETGSPVERPIAQDRYPLPGDRPRERPIELTVAVTSVFKGSVPTRIVVVESLYDRYLRGEGSPLFGDWTWPEEAGVCFGLRSDPTGEDMLMILQPAAQPGQYRLVVGPGPYSAQAAREFGERYPLLAAPYPPSAGNSHGASNSDGPNQPMGAGILLMILGSAAAAWTLLRKRSQ